LGGGWRNLPVVSVDQAAKLKFDDYADLGDGNSSEKWANQAGLFSLWQSGILQ
jgi:hypothetical protein